MVELGNSAWISVEPCAAERGGGLWLCRVVGSSTTVVQLEFRIRVGLGLLFSRYFYRFVQFKGLGYWDLPAPNMSRFLVLT